MDIDKTEDDCADNTKGEDDDDDIYFLPDYVISEKRTKKSKDAKKQTFHNI